MSLADLAQAALAEDGPFADCIDGYRPRPQQADMAGAVAGAIEQGDSLVVEAGTGTGKTLAYLIPALLAGRRVIVSTGTRTLQDQLYHRDLPMARAALERPVRTALLKGRSNYLCLYRMERTLEEGRLEDAGMADTLQQLKAWSGHTRSGDLAEHPAGPPPGRLLPRVTSTADNCLGQNCPLYSECFLMEARRQAQEAEIVVVNHHLLLADWSLRQGGFGEVLPEADVYILDEAHQLPETAARFFGLSLSSRQLQDLVRDTRVEQQREAGDSADILDAAAVVERCSADMRMALGETGKSAWAAVRDEVTPVAEGLMNALHGLTETLGPQAARGRGLENCHRRAEALLGTLKAFLENGDEDNRVGWVETRSQGFILRLTPLDVADHFAGHRERHGSSWILTSATLAVGEDFGHFTQRMGLPDARTLQLDSPFDYARHALLYLPPDLPAPGEARFNQAYLDAVEPVLRASQGRAFLLFTSHRALREAAETLRSRGWSDLLVQGEGAQQQLLERFRERAGGVLLGTQSFWEGVDVRGEALSCVMIDKLPFASPSEPVLQARMAWLRAQGDNPFAHHQLPEAVISLRQGVGRLIRDADDRGVLVLGDNRLTSRSYGRHFLDSLPPMPLTHRLDEVEAFFAQSSTSS